ncbi:hypothetical protein [Methylocaldum sp. RMAD-M]|jgi:hypothetical protein|uniref:hypothetical protein n=1 Tax=Methylocaldum sp. RMAD-M TaxID=2806557 RepID=UPI000A321C39|nr:hypothetical protein [Methylocaldum sp. RMAD-M]MBP1151603.1 glucose dehydrogenase [Methylocaldum sp. RMAD-M]
MNEEKIPLTESLGMFNTYSVEVRSKIDALVRQVLFLSGGVQAITIGAFLNGTPPQFPSEAISLLKNGWLLLSASIVFSLLFMLGQVFAMIAVGLKFSAKLRNSRAGAEIMNAPMPLRVFNWVVGLSAFLACAGGVVALSKAAMSLIGA